MAKINLSAMSAADRMALASQLASFQERDAKLTQLVNAFRADVDAAGFSMAEVAPLLISRKPLGRPAGKKAAAAKPTASIKSSADATGGIPMAGVTYVHPETGAEWTKAESGKGAPKKEFVALVADGGMIWAQLAKDRGETAKKPARNPTKKAVAKKSK